jgi:hypothetical protein
VRSHHAFRRRRFRQLVALEVDGTQHGPTLHTAAGAAHGWRSSLRCESKNRSARRATDPYTVGYTAALHVHVPYAGEHQYCWARNWPTTPVPFPLWQGKGGMGGDGRDRGVASVHPHPSPPPQGGEAVPQPYRVGMPRLRMRRIQVLPRRQMSQTHGAAIRDLRCGMPRHDSRVTRPAEGVVVLR